MGLDLKNFDWEALIEDLAPLVQEGIKHMLSGTKSDIESFAQRITRLLVHAELTGDVAMQEQLMDQLELLAHKQSIRVRNESWTMFSAVLSMVFKAVKVSVKAAL